MMKSEMTMAHIEDAYGTTQPTIVLALKLRRRLKCVLSIQSI